MHIKKRDENRGTESLRRRKERIDRKKGGANKIKIDKKEINKERDKHKEKM